MFYQLLLIADVTNKITKIRIEAILVVRQDHRKTTLRPGNGNIEHFWIIYKLANFIVHCRHDDRLLLSPLKPMDRSHFNTGAKSFFKQGDLRFVRRNDTNINYPFAQQLWLNFLQNHIGLPLVDKTSCVMTGSREHHLHNVMLITIGCHDN